MMKVLFELPNPFDARKPVSVCAICVLGDFERTIAQMAEFWGMKTFKINSKRLRRFPPRLLDPIHALVLVEHLLFYDLD